MNIIKSGIVSAEYDGFWDEATAVTRNLIVKPVLIIVNTYTPGSNEEAQLGKMLGACGLTNEQYNIIQLDKDQQMAWHQLREMADPKVVFLIGVMPAQLGVSVLFQLNSANNFNDRIWLPTLSLAELEQYADIKKQLWVNGMKPVLVDGRGNW
jgi:hypothetical protein